MEWIQAVGLIGGSFIFLALIRDFLAGLGQERIWSASQLDESQGSNGFENNNLAPVIPIVKEDRLDDLYAFMGSRRDDDREEGVRNRLA